MTVGIGYEDDSAAARQLIEQVVTADPRVEQSEPVFVKVWELGDNAVILRIRAWVAAGDMIAARCDLYEAIKDALQKNGFHIPYPQLSAPISRKKHCKKRQKGDRPQPVSFFN